MGWSAMSAQADRHVFNLHRAQRPFPPSSLSDRAEARLQRKKGRKNEKKGRKRKREQSAGERAWASPPGRSASGARGGSNKARTHTRVTPRIV